MDDTMAKKRKTDLDALENILDREARRIMRELLK
jgi:hypothetical protein